MSHEHYAYYNSVHEGSPRAQNDYLDGISFLAFNERGHHGRLLLNFLKSLAITATTKALRSSCGIDIYLKIRQRQSNKRCKKGMVPIPSVQL